MKKYNCSFYFFAGIVPVLLIAVALYLFLIGLSANMALLLIVYVIFCYLGTPTAVMVDDNAIVINQAISPKTINFSDIKSIHKLDGITYAFGNGMYIKQRHPAIVSNKAL